MSTVPPVISRPLQSADRCLPRIPRSILPGPPGCQWSIRGRVSCPGTCWPTPAEVVHRANVETIPTQATKLGFVPEAEA